MSQEMSNFMVQNKKLIYPIPVQKVTKFLSEKSTFFKKSDSETAMFAIMNVIKGIRMNEQTLFGRISVNYTNVKWSVRNFRNLNYFIVSR